jgi:hypothetical protein
MTTKDPAQVRHERLERWRGHPGVLAAVVVASAATVALGVLAGLGFGGFMEQFRTMAIDSVFDDRGDGDPPYVVVWGTLGVFGGLLAATLAGAAARRYRGRPFSFADWWMPGLLLVVTLLALGHGVVAHRRYAEMVRTRERLLAHGRRVPADVVEVKLRLASDETGTRVVGAIVTVSFTDLAGVRRRVTRRSRETEVSAAEVLFDPARPEDEKSIFVALRRHPVLADWLPAR